MIRELVVCACVLPFGADIAWSCPGQTGKAIFTDDFSDDSGGWDLDSNVAVTSGALNLTSDSKTKTDGSLNSTFNATDGDYCLVFTFPTTAPDSGEEDYVSLMFLASDYKNRYQFSVGTSGEAWISRAQNNNWTTLMPATKVAAIKAEPGSENTLRAVVKDGKITFFVNGAQVKALRAQISDTSNKFGFFGGSVSHPPANPRVTLIKSYGVTEAQ